MAILDKKVSEIYSGRDISSLSDRPNEDGLQAPDLKARFDQLGKEVIPNFNDLIEELNGILNGDASDIDALQGRMDNAEIDIDGLELSRMLLTGSNSNIDVLSFFTETIVPFTKAGQLRWNEVLKTLELKISDNVTLHIGKEILLEAMNDEATLISNGQAVYVSGGAGTNVYIKRASTANVDIAQSTIGVAIEPMQPGEYGHTCTEGIVNGINTNAWEEGDKLYLGIDGALTNVEPTSPTPKVFMGVVLRKHLTLGSIYVKVRAIPRMAKLSDVFVSSIADGHALIWNGTTGRFENEAIYNKTEVDALANARYTKTEVDAQLAETDQRIDNIIATPIDLPEIYVDEIHDARQGKASVGANITEVKSLLAENASKTKSDKKSGIMASQRNAFKHFEKLPLATIGTFEPSETWEQVAATVSADTVKYKSGTQGLKLTSVNGVEAKAQRTGLTLNLFTASYIDLWVYVEQPVNISTIDLYLHTTDADYYRMRINPQIHTKYQRDGWIRLKIPKNSTYTIATGSPSFLNNIVKVALAVNSIAGTTASATFDNMAAYESGARLGKVMMRFDDGYTSIATTGKAILDKYNQRGVLAILPNKVATAGYANLEQLKNLENTGWDIINHTWNHDNLSFASAETAREVIESASEWMVENGIGNGNVVVLPGHATNATVQGVCEELNIITCTGLSGYETLPPADPHALKSLAGESVSASAIKSYIDACALDKSFLILLFHSVDNTGSAYSVSPAILDEVCAYIATKAVDVVTFSDLITPKTLLTEKANKLSGGQQSTTMLNGWGGFIVFSKNDMGEVWVRGSLILGTKTFGTAILSLPEGFRPPFSLPVPFFDSSGKTIHGAVLLNNGSIRVYEGATGATYTDASINFKFNTQ